MRTLRFGIVVWFSLVTPAVIAGGTARQQAEAEWKSWEAQSKPLVGFSGAQSKLDRTEFRRITNSKDWVALWCRHVGKSKKEYDHHNRFGVPEVDFASCTVVTATLGKTFNTAGVQARYNTSSNSAVVLRIVRTTYQTGSKADAVQPFGFFVLPRSKQRMLVELDVHEMIGDPPKWKQVASFEALK